jgi:hypothetical protein
MQELNEINETTTLNRPTIVLGNIGKGITVNTKYELIILGDVLPGAILNVVRPHINILPTGSHRSANCVCSDGQRTEYVGSVNIDNRIFSDDTVIVDGDFITIRSSVPGKLARSVIDGVLHTGENITVSLGGEHREATTCRLRIDGTIHMGAYIYAEEVTCKNVSTCCSINSKTSLTAGDISSGCAISSREDMRLRGVEGSTLESTMGSLICMSLDRCRVLARDGVRAGSIKECDITSTMGSIYTDRVFGGKMSIRDSITVGICEGCEAKCSMGTFSCKEVKGSTITVRDNVTAQLCDNSVVQSSMGSIIIDHITGLSTIRARDGLKCDTIGDEVNATCTMGAIYAMSCGKNAILTARDMEIHDIGAGSKLTSEGSIKCKTLKTGSIIKARDGIIII